MSMFIWTGGTFECACPSRLFNNLMHSGIRHQLVLEGKLLEGGEEVQMRNGVINGLAVLRFWSMD